MKIICVGRNFSLHASEFNNSIPNEPIFFLKPDTALLRNNEPFYIPHFSNNIQCEVELVFRICKVGKNILQRFAYRYYDAIALGIDFTARDVQQECIQKGLPWEKAKSFDYSAAISSFIEKAEFENINNISFCLHVNNQIVQQASVSDMIFNIDKIISYVSQFITLKIGDLIYTGTPHGVKTVKIGDHLEGYINEKKMFDFYIR